MPILEFEKVAVLQSWVDEGRISNIDLSDLLVALSAKSCGCSGGISFDKKVSKKLCFRLLT
jgi:predicted nucleic-acid-binding protein